MTVSIITCPACNAILLEDTAQCPTCQHVLAGAATPRIEPRSDPAPAPAPVPASGEVYCAACGEGVRIGMVRCWNCGTFMQPGMAEAYQQKLMAAAGFVEPRGPEPPVWTQAADEAAALSREQRPPSSDEIPLLGDAPDANIEAHDEDFEVAPQFAFRAPTLASDSYSLSWNATSESSDIPLAPMDEPPRPSAPPPIAAVPDEPAEPETIPLSRPQPAEAATNADTPPAPTPLARESANGAPRAPSPQAPPDAADGTAHSVATAGDVLLQIALDEEKQTATRRGRPVRKVAGLRNRDGFLVYCPSGHRVEVQEKHRGLVGRCPRCKQPFFVPAQSTQTESRPTDESAPASEATVATPAAATVPSGPNPWLKDVAAHAVNMAKIKPKPGCLAKPTHAVDVVVRPEGLLVLTLAKAGGLFGAKKVDPIREAAQAHLHAGRPAAELSVAARLEVPADAFPAIKVVQPAAYAHESPFGDVAVFPAGRVAVQLPAAADAVEKTFLALTLSQFRDFASLMKGLGQAAFGDNCGIPLVDSFTDLVCHYSDRTLRTLNDVAYYQADPAFKVELLGRKCAECGLIVSEDSRKKEKIGGSSGSGIAKAKCPKCQKKFGSLSLYGLAGS